jgi:maltooligosyltrehalose trehalohydrolase
VAKGRKEFLSQFRTIACPEAEALLVRPDKEETFLRCKLDFSERQTHAEVYQLHRDLIHLRLNDPVFGHNGPVKMDGAVLGSETFLLRYFDGEHGDRLVVVNLGPDLHLDPAPEPLLAPLENQTWRVLWSSENPAYGGCGTPPVDGEENWQIPGKATIVFIPDSGSEKTNGKDNSQNRSDVEQG